MQAKLGKPIYVCVYVPIYLSVNSVLFVQLFCIAYRIAKYGDIQGIVYCSPLNFIDFVANILNFFPALSCTSSKFSQRTDAGPQVVKM